MLILSYCQTQIKIVAHIHPSIEVWTLEKALVFVVGDILYKLYEMLLMTSCFFIYIWSELWGKKRFIMSTQISSDLK